MTHRTILITGTSSGIGLASAQTMAQRGWCVFATARRSEDLKRLARIPGVEPVMLDLRDDASIAACAETVLQRCGGRLDALFNNAGFGQVGAVEDLTSALLRDQLQVNLVGLHALTRHVLPTMREAGRGRIVMCSSVLGFAAAPYRGAYCASKFALEGLTDALRLELIGSGIHVSLIEPGPIATRFVETALAQFRSSIDIERSPHREDYLRRLAAMEKGGKSTFKLQPEAVVGKLIHAVEHARPRRRYYVTVPTYLAAIGRRLLPGAAFDRLLSRS